MSPYRTVRRSRQRGLSFIGVIIIGLLAVSAFAIGGQSLPILMEYKAVLKAANKAKLEATVTEVRASFNKSAQVDNIKSVNGEDLEITKQGNKVVVGIKYSREIPLAGPAYLVYRFQTQTD